MPDEDERSKMMSERRYGYCDEIAAIVDMSKTTIEGGEEMTTSDVVERLNQLEAENATLKRENERLKAELRDERRMLLRELYNNSAISQYQFDRAMKEVDLLTPEEQDDERVGRTRDFRT